MRASDTKYIAELAEQVFCEHCCRCTTEFNSIADLRPVGRGEIIDEVLTWMSTELDGTMAEMARAVQKYFADALVQVMGKVNSVPFLQRIMPSKQAKDAHRGKGYAEKLDKNLGDLICRALLDHLAAVKNERRRLEAFRDFEAENARDEEQLMIEGLLGED
ncbi:MAG: hypothetical protein WCG97_02460 [bacterium]